MWILKRQWLRRSALLACVASSCLATAVHGQEAGDAAQAGHTPATSGQDIVVTAQFRSQNLQDVPLAITAVDAAMLASRGQTNLTQLSSQAPNVTIQPAPSGYGPAAQVSIRGIGQIDTSLAFEPGVGVYIDDVYYSTVFGNAFEIVDLDRVEILRGPQGTLAGKNSIGGAIRLFSKKPDADADGRVEVKTGSFGLASIRAATNLTIAPDLYARVSGSASHVKGYVKRLDFKCVNPSSTLPSLASGNDCVLGREGGRDDITLRGTLRWAGRDGVEVNIIGDWFRSNGDPAASTLLVGVPVLGGAPYGSLYIPSDRRTNYSTYQAPAANFFPPVEQRLEQWGISGTVDLDISDNVSLKSITAYRNTSGTFVADSDVSPLAASLFIQTTRQRQFTQEVRLNAQPVEILDLTLGAYYYNGKGGQPGRTLAGSGFLDFILDDRVTSKNKSAFGHAAFHLDALTFTLGIRYSDESKRYFFNRQTTSGAFSPFISPIDGLVGNFSGSRWDYRAVIDYRWSDNLMTYAQFSTGFKGGGINPRPFYPNQVVDFGQETVTAYEVGFKSDLFDRLIRLNVSAFLSKYKDLQVQTGTPFFNVNLPVQSNPLLPFWNPVGGTFPAGVFLNAGDGDLKGLEAELTLRPAPGLSIEATASYLDFEYKSLLPQAVASGITANMTTPLSPKWKASIGAQYEIGLGSAGTLTPRIDYAYKSSSFGTAVNHPRNRLESSSVINLMLTYRTENGDWEAALGVTNLTNDFYYYSKFDLLSAAGYVNGTPARPREWSLSIRRQF